VTTRKSLSKKQRFEIFKRDLFTCQYCGSQPPNTVLVIDHIHPVADGGDNDEMNLITSCVACNQGKGARVLGDVHPKPDADLEYLKIQQETAELRRYIFSKQERDEVMDVVIDKLRDYWCEMFNTEYTPYPRQFKKWLTCGTPEDIEKAIYIASGKDIQGSKIKYVSGIFWNLVRQDHER